MGKTPTNPIPNPSVLKKTVKHETSENHVLTDKTTSFLPVISILSLSVFLVARSHTVIMSIIKNWIIG